MAELSELQLSLARQAISEKFGWPVDGTLTTEVLRVAAPFLQFPANTRVRQENGVDLRIEAVKNVLGNLSDEGGRIFSTLQLDKMAKLIIFWIDEVGK